MMKSGQFTGIAWWTISLVGAHLVVEIVHGTAHLVLGIVPPLVDIAFITIVIGLLPLVALPFVLRGSRAAMAILTLAFAASWLYGMVNHFIVEGSDHVTGLSHGAWQTTFTVTGVLLLILEAAGTLLAAWLFWRTSRTRLHGTPAHEAPSFTPR